MANFKIFSVRSIVFEYNKLLASFYFNRKGLRAIVEGGTPLSLLDAKRPGSSRVNNGTFLRQKGLCLQSEQRNELTYFHGVISN